MRLEAPYIASRGTSPFRNMWITLILTGLVGVAAAAYVVWPLFRRTPFAVTREREELADLLTRKDVALEAIRELEFDHRVGKIEDGDFERFNGILRSRAIRLIEHIEAHYGHGEGTDLQVGQLDETLEAEISGRRRVEEAGADEGGGGLREE